MPSLLPEFEYDIFISYRQHDNSAGQRPGWVSNFVESLREELRATVKTPVNIYFDRNTYDGLLELHQVDASLEKKLKCLIFIPIVSQTYCDPKSYAWQHELIPFARIAREDELGMTISLANGNVVNRVLPVKIHDLDADDQQLLENELQGPLRSIDFIYKEPGVNRPLTPDDKEEKNLNATLYRNQLNKVANTVKEMGAALLKRNGTYPSPPIAVGAVPSLQRLNSYSKGRLRQLVFAGLVVGLAVLGYFGFIRFNSGRLEITIAVLPFTNLSSDKANEFFTAGVHEDIMTNLGGLKDLKVISRTSVMQYKDHGGNLKEIGARLGARYLVEGSVRREGDQILVNAQLIDASNDQSLWSARYDRKLSNVFELQSAIAREIASTLNARISQGELARLNTVPTVVMEAYDNYLKARALMSRSWVRYENLMEAISLLQQATTIDPNFLEGWALLARSQSVRVGQVREFDGRETEVAEAEHLAEAALTRSRNIDPASVETLKAEGAYYYIVKGDKVTALKSLDKALEARPSDSETLGFQAEMYMYLGQLDLAMGNLEKAYALDPASERAMFMVGYAYTLSHRYAQLVPYLKHLIEIYPDRTHYVVEEKYYQFLLDGQLASFHEFENAVKSVKITPSCDERAVKNNEMVVAMMNGAFGDYAKAWAGRYEDHYKGHGNWSCPAKLNDEANQANLLFRFGDRNQAEEIITRAKASSTRPINEKSLCIFDKAVLAPKLDFMSGDKVLARKTFDDMVPRVLKNNSFPRGQLEKEVLLQTADLVAPDRVYALYTEIMNDPASLVSMETVCADPWTFPNLIRDPKFIEEVRKDGRFVEFLEHYKLLAKA